MFNKRWQKPRTAALKEATANAEVARKQIGDMATEFVFLSKQVAEQSEANNKLKAELDKPQAEFERLQAEINACWKREAIATKL